MKSTGIDSRYETTTQINNAADFAALTEGTRIHAYVAGLCDIGDGAAIVIAKPICDRKANNYTVKVKFARGAKRYQTVQMWNITAVIS